MGRSLFVFLIYLKLLPLFREPLLMEIFNAKSPSLQDSIVFSLRLCVFALKLVQILQGGNLGYLPIP